MSRLFQLPGGYNDWRLALGAQSHIGRLGVNLVMYSLCLDYKTEQAHIDYILRTRRQPR